MWIVAIPRSFRCKAILFDLDGVLVDSTECVERTWRGWATRHSLDPDTVISLAHGRPTRETVRLVAPELGVEAEAALLEAGEAMASEGIYKIPGAREILESLPKGSWAVVTSGTRAIAEFRLKLTGLPIPPVLICADEIERGKPDPQGYLTAAARLHRSADECVVIEDAPLGIAAARAARMRVIAIAATYARDRLASADAVVETLADLTIRSDADGVQIDIR
ncbi:MAG: phosphatase [Gemmatimonadetes bacterium]|nr:MAG: phosphatase [Gemmatimonadota bacterium]